MADFLAAGRHGGQHRLVTSEQRGVVEFGFVEEHVGVCVSGYCERPLADVFADSGPGDTAEVHERNPPVAEVVGAEEWDSGGCAAAAELGSKGVAAEPVEHLAVQVAVLARTEINDDLENRGGRCDPARPDGLGDALSDSPAAAR